MSQEILSELGFHLHSDACSSVSALIFNLTQLAAAELHQGHIWPPVFTPHASANFPFRFRNG